MKKEDFYELLGELDAGKIKAAEKPPVRPLKRNRIGIAAACAACLALILTAGIALHHRNAKPPFLLLRICHQRMHPMWKARMLRFTISAAAKSDTSPNFCPASRRIFLLHGRRKTESGMRLNCWA